MTATRDRQTIRYGRLPAVEVMSDGQLAQLLAVGMESEKSAQSADNGGVTANQEIGDPGDVPALARRYLKTVGAILTDQSRNPDLVAEVC